MKEIDSLYHLERLIYRESLTSRKEKLFLTNGRLFMEIGTNGDSKGVYVNIAKETEFLERYKGIFVYSYHTHIKNAHLTEYPEPPLPLMIFVQTKDLEKEPIRKERKLFQEL